MLQLGVYNLNILRSKRKAAELKIEELESKLRVTEMKLEAEKNYGLTDVYFTSNFNGNIKLNAKTL